MGTNISGFGIQAVWRVLILAKIIPTLKVPICFSTVAKDNTDLARRKVHILDCYLMLHARMHAAMLLCSNVTKLLTLFIRFHAIDFILVDTIFSENDAIAKNR